MLAAAIGLAAFVSSWFIQQLPLRETVLTADMADTFAPPRHEDSLAEIATKLGRLDRRQGAREIMRRVSERAGVELNPAACWLLAMLSREPPSTLESLARRAGVAPAVLNAAGEQLLARGLIERAGHEQLRLTAEGQATLERLRATGEQRLSDLLREWRPQQDPALAHLITELAHDFLIDTDALETRSSGALGAAAGV
jgi:DNA-binding MarR family transcriptional regulator